MVDTQPSRGLDAGIETETGELSRIHRRNAICTASVLYNTFAPPLVAPMPPTRPNHRSKCRWSESIVHSRRLYTISRPIPVRLSLIKIRGRASIINIDCEFRPSIRSTDVRTAEAEFVCMWVIGSSAPSRQQGYGKLCMEPTVCLASLPRGLASEQASSEGDGRPSFS